MFLEEEGVAHWDKVMRINYMGVVCTLKAALPGMVARNKGRIIVTNSSGGFMGAHPMLLAPMQRLVHTCSFIKRAGALCRNLAAISLPGSSAVLRAVPHQCGKDHRCRSQCMQVSNSRNRQLCVYRSGWHLCLLRVKICCARLLGLPPA